MKQTHQMRRTKRGYECAKCGYQTKTQGYAKALGKSRCFQPRAKK